MPFELQTSANGVRLILAGRLGVQQARPLWDAMQPAIAAGQNIRLQAGELEDMDTSIIQILCRVCGQTSRLQIGETSDGFLAATMRQLVCRLKAKVAQSRMIIGAAAERPMIFAIRFLDWKIIDARESQPHQAILVELPILVAIRAIPVSRIVVPFVGEAHCDPVIGEGPKLLGQAVVELFDPLASEKGDDVLSSIHKL
jgi:ABC-type transporter Mla MlaB component